MNEIAVRPLGTLGGRRGAFRIERSSATRQLLSRLGCALALVGALARGALAQAPGSVPGFSFQGRMLVVASDADMLASAYIDGRLGPPGGPDVLSVIKLDRRPGEMRPATVEVANSVVGPPSSVAVTPDGRYAVVVETRGRRPAGKPDAVMRDLGVGRAVTVVDLIDTDHPKVVQQVQGPENPVSVSVSGDGALVAVAHGPPYAAKAAPLAIYRFGDGRLSGPLLPDVPGFGPGDALQSAEFHPTGVLALVYAKQPRLSFVRVAADGDGFALARWGNDVGLDHAPFLVRFTRDGHYALVNDMFVGADVRDVRGTVSSIAVAVGTVADGTPRHLLVSHAEAGLLPEGLAVSPDGRWVVTSNLENSTYPVTDPRQGFFSSLTLMRLDPDTGRLERVGDFSYDAVIPEAVVFDNSSRYLATASFDRFDGAKPGGSVDFWRLADDGADPRRAVLVRTSISVPVARGPQSMAIVR